MLRTAHFLWFSVLSILLIVYYLTDFGQAPTISNEEKNIYSLLTPLAVGLVILELIYCWLARKDYFTFQESIANFCTAMGNQSTNVLVAVAVYFTYGYLWEQFHWLSIPMDAEHWYNWLILLLGIDFIFYWVHRWGHEVNIMWAAHSPHHSAEEMNLMVGLRASITQRLMSFFFFWPLTIIGFEPFDIYMMTGVHLFIGYWHHTEVLPKFWRWIEFFFNTPSHHRVHHGVNLKYLDKNYAEFLIIWDRIFGTFEEETDKVVYGMYNGPKSWNPIKINFHYYNTLWQTALAAPYWWDKIRIWFMPLTWQPRGLPEYVPNEEITLENQVRYQSVMFKHSKTYLILHLLICLVMMLSIINGDSTWTTFERWIGAAFLWHTIVNLSGILESKPWLLVSEIIRLIFMPIGLILFNDWQTEPLYILLILATALLSAFWTTRYFRPTPIPPTETPLSAPS
ncbi:MAG: Fatty acid hydroxylase family protein [uncultured Aureispira sp.]|uniref:Fatty acid hydroxylase family protein n=1 Tax=uncultured Aureispira sp. TaxID=1331704 RepID=A0A6S6SY49_9BACT|nr:MAG: Fatty acid hydroxylase family protein [uncultured Aureispira sp.]